MLNKLMLNWGKQCKYCGAISFFWDAQYIERCTNCYHPYK